MQSDDGGWETFDRDNNKLFLNGIPFRDIEAMCDPSEAYVTAQILEAYGLVLKCNSHEKSEVPDEMKAAIRLSADRALQFLVTTQEKTGAWFGRWGVNYNCLPVLILLLSQKSLNLRSMLNRAM